MCIRDRDEGVGDDKCLVSGCLWRYDWCKTAEQLLPAVKGKVTYGI